MSADRYPWHASPLQQLARTDRWPHALLLTGSVGLGKRALAEHLVQRLVCHTPSPSGPCGRCKGCALFNAAAHPDVLRVEPAETKKEIGIDAVRELSEFMALKPHSGQHKVVLIAPAEALNPHAANALLKVLEEPPAGAYLILVSHDFARLLSTVRSRCVRLNVSAPPFTQGLAWLAQHSSAPQTSLSVILEAAREAPLAALQLLEQGAAESFSSFMTDLEAVASGGSDVASVAASWKKQGTALAVTWLQTWLADYLAQRPAACTVSAARLLQGTDPRDVFRLLDAVTDARRLLQGPLDELLLLEDLLIRWLRLHRRRAHG
ncbi:MAG TPA: DNA polymerase III subunit delta' [Acidiferrobacteraceae bacterium]|nr:DNA polymerase III subunit delta' [Acidiferrobacteraceae bacterium]